MNINTPKLEKSWRELDAENDALRAENARLREALEYYANQDYNAQGLGDDGVVARAALAGRDSQ